MGDPRFQQPSLIAKRLDNAASKRPTLWSSKGNLCKPSCMHPLRLRHAEQSRRSVPRLQPSGTDAPFFAAVLRVRPADNHRGPRSNLPVIAACRLLAWDRLRSIRACVAGFSWCCRSSLCSALIHGSRRRQSRLAHDSVADAVLSLLVLKLRDKERQATAKTPFRRS